MDEHKSFRERMKEMTWPERAVYFRDYYLIWTAAGIALGMFLIYVVWGYTHMPPAEVLYTFVFNDLYDPDVKAETAAELADLFSVKEEQIVLDDGHEVGDDGDMQIAVLFASKRADLVICPRDEFERLAGEGAFVDLTDVFDEEFCEKWKDSFVTASGYVEQDLSYSEDPFREAGNGVGEELPYGIMISDGSRYSEISLTGSDLICGVVSNSQYQQNAVAAIEYFMGK